MLHSGMIFPHLRVTDSMRLLVGTSYTLLPTMATESVKLASLVLVAGVKLPCRCQHLLLLAGSVRNPAPAVYAVCT